MGVFKTIVTLSQYDNDKSVQKEVNVDLYRTLDDYMLMLQEPCVFVESVRIGANVYLDMGIKGSRGLSLNDCGLCRPKLNNALYYIEARTTRLVTEILDPINERSAFLVHGIGIRIRPNSDAWYVLEQAPLRRFCRILEFEVNMKAKIIQRAFRRAISDPNYKICQRRLHNEFRGLVSDISGVGV